MALNSQLPTLNPHPDTTTFKADFYVTGGTLRSDAPSYVERQADKDLCHGMLHGEFCYVLTPRQMGKSSLMVRTVKRLREDGVAVAVLDLTAIGQNLTIDQWYDGLVSRLGQQFHLEDELTDYWEAHPEFGPLQRWLTAIEKVILVRITGPVVIFIDEIDIVRSLPFSTDEFFAAIREAYNRRSREPAFARLAFGLLGVATPTDLIRDTRLTPFNIGRRIELDDFTAEEAAPLARGLGPDEGTAERLLERVLYWTGGHPYLTQRLCRALADSLSNAKPGTSEPTVPPVIPTPATVDDFAESLFLSRQARDRDDNLIFVRERLLRSEVDGAGLLYLYRKVLNGERVPNDDANPMISVLQLSGVTQAKDGELRVRNRIYSHVFDHVWIQTNMPAAEIRRQRGARRKGVLLGLSIGVLLLLTYLLVWPAVREYRTVRLANRTAQQVEAAYRHMTSYRDTFESTVEIGVGGLSVPVRGSGSIVYHRPDTFNLVVRSDFSTAETEVRIASDGRLLRIDAPTLKQFKVSMAPASNWSMVLPSPLAEHIGPVRVLPVYRLLLERGAADAFTRGAFNVRYSGVAEVDGQRVRVLNWEQTADELLGPLGLTNQTERARVPVTAWVSTAENQVLQMRLDLSPWAKQLVGEPADVNITSLVLTETHKTIESSTTPMKPLRPHFAPPPGAMPVTEFRVPSHDLATLAFMKRQFSRMIPQRFSNAPPTLIDLTEYYNAPLSKAWHDPGMSENNLDPLPAGILQFGSVFFDVRGIVQLSGKGLESFGGRYPQSISGIKIGQRCRELHFLHATGWRARDGTRVGGYVIHYRDDQEQVIPIVYGEDVRDWAEQSDPSRNLKRANMVWSVMNRASKTVRLFKTTWVNPMPDNEILTIDYSSTMSDAAPFLIAVTAEP